MRNEAVLTRPTPLDGRRLYFVGNLSRTPPEGNGPRYPFVIAEVDEEKLVQRKDSVTVIDDRDPEVDAQTVGIWGRPFENRENRTLGKPFLESGYEIPGQGVLWSEDETLGRPHIPDRG